MSQKILNKLAEEHGLILDPEGSSLPVDRGQPTSKAASRIRTTAKRGRKTNERRYPWHLMEDGDSFVVETRAEAQAAYHSLKAYLTTKACHLDGEYRMMSRRTETGSTRCFLVAVPDAEPRPDLTVDKDQPILTLAQQWIVDRATARAICDRDPSFRLVSWAEDRRVMVVDTVTGKPVWMNEAAQRHFDANEAKAKRIAPEA